MNKIIVIGHLGRDPQMRYLPSGQGVSNFSVATSRKYTTSSGEHGQGLSNIRFQVDSSPCSLLIRATGESDRMCDG